MNLNKLLPIFSFLFLALSPTAQAQDVLEKYKVLSEQFIQDANDDKTVEVLLPTVLQLKDLGMQILDLYRETNPSCAEQLTVMKEEFQTLEETDLTKLFDRYHEANGLPKGPFHCIYGRAYPLHPVMVEVRLRQGWNEEQKKDGINDIQEMIKYLPNLKKNLTNPPQG